MPNMCKAWEVKMKYSIAGFSQQKLIDHDIDLTDAHILRWILDFMPNMKKHTVNQKQYVWLKQSYFLAEMPVCGIKSRQGLDKRLVKMVEKGFMEKMHITHKGGRCCYVLLTDKVGDLVTQSHDNHSLQGTATHDNHSCRGHDNHSLQGHDNSGLHARDSSITDSSISNPSINTPLTPQGEKKPDDDFEQFWTSFPRQRRGDKQNTQKKWGKALEKGYTVEQIIQGVMNYQHSREVAEGYAMNAASWLHNAKFLDNYQPPANKAPEVNKWDEAREKIRRGEL